MNIYITSPLPKAGKTFVSIGLCAVMQSLGYNTGYYKPVLTGAEINGNKLYSAETAFANEIDPYIKRHATYTFTSEAFPAFAASEDNVLIETKKIKAEYDVMSANTDVLTVEAPGGLLTPISTDIMAYKLPLLFKIPSLFVITPDTGNINTLLNEINTARMFGAEIKGIVINNMPAFSFSREIKAFPKIIEKYSDSKVLGIISTINTTPTANILINEFLNGIDFQTVFGIKIPKLDV